MIKTINKLASQLGQIGKSGDNVKIGFDGLFTLDARISDRLSRKSTVPTFYVEDGSFVNDHIINDPLIISLSGEVANTVYQSNIYLDGYNKINENIGIIRQYLPSRTSTQLSKLNGYIGKAIDVNRKINKVVNDFKDVSKFIKGTDSQSVQNQFVEYLENVFKSKKLIKIETEFGIYENMRIVTYDLTKTENSFISYTITLQEVRFAQTILRGVKAIAKKPTGDAATQTADKVNKGEVQGKKKSLITKIGDLF